MSPFRRENAYELSAIMLRLPLAGCLRCSCHDKRDETRMLGVGLAISDRGVCVHWLCEMRLCSGLCRLLRFSRLVPSSGSLHAWRWRRLPLRCAGGPALLPQAPPELERLLPADLSAVFQQRLRLIGDPLAAGHLQALAPPVPTGGPKMQHLAPIAEPGLPGCGDRLRPPPEPTRADGSGLRSSCGSGG
jgi:hypothetical protein